MHHPAKTLRKRSRDVGALDQSVFQLIADMTDTVMGAKGSGLAAVQIGVPLRVVVLSCNDGGTIALINPRIIERSGSVDSSEGCLSLPGRQCRLKRSARVVIEHLRGGGMQKLDTMTGVQLAVAIQHELDHLNGVLIIDREPHADRSLVQAN